MSYIMVHSFNLHNGVYGFCVSLRKSYQLIFSDNNDSVSITIKGSFICNIFQIICGVLDMKYNWWDYYRIASTDWLSIHYNSQYRYNFIAAFNIITTYFLLQLYFFIICKLLVKKNNYLHIAGRRLQTIEWYGMIHIQLAISTCNNTWQETHLHNPHECCSLVVCDNFVWFIQSPTR